MSDSVQPKLNLNQGNPAEQWSEWLRSFQFYLIATETNKKEERIQIAQLLHFAGPELQKIYSTFTFKEDEKEKLQTVIEKINHHFTPRQNLTYLRYKFFTAKQTDDMSIENFTTHLRNSVKSCGFGTLTDDYKVNVDL